MNREAVVVAGLLIAVTTTALAVVYGKYRHRMLVNEQQRLERALDALEVEWEQLLIEEHALADPALIERVARRRLDMVVPRTEEIVYLTVSQAQ